MGFFFQTNKAVVSWTECILACVPSSSPVFFTLQHTRAFWWVEYNQVIEIRASSKRKERGGAK